MRSFILFLRLAGRSIARTSFAASIYVGAGAGTCLAAIFISGRTPLSVVAGVLGVAMIIMALLDVDGMMRFWASKQAEAGRLAARDPRVIRLHERVESNKSWLVEETRK